MKQDTMEIPLSGLSTSPNDLSSQDGNLAIALGVVHEDGAIKNASHTAPKILRHLGANREVLHQHRSADYTHFLYKDNNGSYKWFDNNSASFIGGAAEAVMELPSFVLGRSAVMDDGSLSNILGNLTLSAVLDDDSTAVVSANKLIGEPKRINIEATIDTKGTPVAIYALKFSLRRNGKTIETKEETPVGNLCSTYINTPNSRYGDAFDVEVSLTWALNGVGHTDTLRGRFSCAMAAPEEDEEDAPVVEEEVVVVTTKLQGEFAEVPTDSVNNVTTLGNTVIFTTDDNNYYYLWKIKDGVADYNYLGTHLPELEMSFGLTPHFYWSSGKEDSTTVDVSDSEYFLYGSSTFEAGMLTAKQGEEKDALRYYFPESDIPVVTNAVLGEANKFTGEWCNENGYFSQPFLVRFALKLYDQSLTMHSAPVLMLPSNGMNPFVFVRSVYAGYEYHLDTIGYGFSLRYRLKNKEILDDWSDIVKGVEIYASAPIYTYDQSGECKYVLRPDFTSLRVDQSAYDMLSNKHCIGKSGTGSNLDIIKNFWQMADTFATGHGFHLSTQPSVVNIVGKGNTTDGAGQAICYNKSGSHRVWYIGNKQGTAFNPCEIIPLPKRDMKDINDDIKNCSLFYLLKSFMIEDLQENDDVELKNIAERVTDLQMTGDFESHHNIVPKVSVGYNNRLNLADVSKSYFDGFSPFSAFQRCGQSLNPEPVDIYVYIKNSTSEYVVKKSSTDRFADNFMFNYFYYPDPDAYKVRIYRADNKYVEYPMHSHIGLNGSLAYIGIEQVVADEDTFKPVTSRPAVSEHKTVHLPNYLYTSEVNNPFIFKAANVEQVGSGSIIAMIPQAVAMSEGQFGEFPMMCFTDTGIWALSVSETGSWIAKQPFSRDVLLNANAVLQMDKEVLFASERGLMIVNGSSVECISEVFDGHTDLFVNAYKQYIDNALSTYLGIRPMPAAPTYKEYISGEKSSMVYDYAHQRVICANEDYPFSFVFSKKDRLWTCVMLNIKSPVNSYPNALVNLNVGSATLLVDLTKQGEAIDIMMPESGFILTRPLKLGNNMLKTVTGVVADGTMHKSHVDIILYVSNDLKTWKVASTTKGSRLINMLGTPYRFFRVGLITRLAEDEELVSLNITYESRNSLSEY